MSHCINRRFGRAAGVVGVLFVIAGQALGQNAPADPVLRGPEVKDNAIPGERGSFSKGAKQKREAAANAPLPPRMFLGALNALRGEKVAENVRLTPEQDEKIRTIQKEFGDSAEAYMKEHGREIRTLLAQLSPEERRMVEQRVQGFFRGGQARPLKDKPARKTDAAVPDEMQSDKPVANEAEQAAAKARIKELMESAPSPKDAQAKVWNVLTDSQRPLVEAELKVLRERVAKGPGLPNASPNEAGSGTKVKSDNVKTSPENLRKRLQNLSPEEREEAMRRLQERRKNNPNSGDPKPAPDMDDVNVPPANTPK